jgi:hypothetical protein
MAILFVPIAFGLGDLYLWAQPAVVARDELLQHKAAYLNVPFFLGRTVLYFVAWIGLTYALNRWSLEQDRTADVGLSRRMQLFSGPGIGVYGLTVTFASFDWLMSLDPHWYSTLFGAWFVAGQGLSALAFAIAALYWLSDRQPLAEVVTTGIFHDLGKLLLAFVMVWAYLSFSQFLIIFSANLPEEITYYLDRSRGGWQWVAAALVLLHFVVPFVLLLSRQMKRNPGLLAIVAAGVFLMRFVDMTWLVVPNFTHAEMRIHWMDLLAPVGLGGIWLGLCLRQVKTRPLLPLHDPYMDEALGRGTH